MHIIFLVTHMSHIGGAQQVVHLLAEAFSEKGYDSHVVSGGKSIYYGPYSQTEIDALQRGINPFRDGRALLAIRRELKCLKPDVLSLHSTKAALLGRLAAWGLPIQVVYHVHGTAYYDCAPKVLRPALGLLEAMLSLLTDQYVFLSKTDAHKWRHFVKKKTSIIANGALSRPFTPITGSQPFRFLWVARLSPPKRLDKILESFSRLKDYEWHLTVIGDGPLRKDLEHRAKSLALTERVTFLGQVEKPDSYYAQSNCVVLSSDAEGMPLTIVEAMSVGRAVVASDVGAIGEVVIDGVTGYTVKDSFHPYLERLIKYPQIAARMGEEAHKRFTEHYTAEKTIERTEQLYRSLGCEHEV